MYSKQFNVFKTILYYVIGNLNQLLKRLKSRGYVVANGPSVINAKN